MADNQTPTGEGKSRVTGSIIPNKATLGAHLKSGKILGYAVGGLLTVGAIGYVAVDTLHGFSSDSHPEHKAAVKAPTFRAKNPETRKTVSTPGPKGSATASTQSSATADTSGQAPANASAPAKPSPQATAFEQAIKGPGSVGWGNSQSAAPAPASTAQTSPELQEQLDLAKSLQATAKKGKEKSVYGKSLVRKEVSPYELLQGAVIPANLETGIKSDIAGEVTAVVSHPVYNSLNASTVLIPGGSRLIGYYKSGAAMGQDRIGVMWTRIEFPDGTYIRLSSMPGTSPRGYAGFKDLVDNHTWEIFKNALLLSLIDVGMTIASPSGSISASGAVTGNVALVEGEQSLAQTFGEAEAQLFQKYINVAPTLTIRPGYTFNVVVTKDLIFPGPYQHGVNQVATDAVGQAAQPSARDPYLGGAS